MAEAEADIGEARATALRAKNDPKPGAPDTAQAALARATARESELSAHLREAQAQLTAAHAQIDSLDMRAPFEGIVLKSDIEVGNYVSAAAGGRALLTLASGLSQLKLVTNIPEAQLGAVHVGEPAEFTVPAFPRTVFPAILTALDLSPKKETKDGKAIISYPATISANNPDGALRPGMSANAMVIIAQARNALVVPNQALTFSPPPDIEAKYPKPKMSVAAGQQPGRVWVLNGEDPEPRDITLGLTDGRITQIAAGSLRAGEKIIINTIH
jgi:HlyD family secretion protein